MRMALLGLCLLCACQSTAKRVRVPMFVGKPVISSLRPEIVALHALGAPKPAVRRLQLAVRVTANGKPLGESTERIGQTSDGFGEYVEEGSYRATDGRCTLSSRNQGVAIGGFLELLEADEVWSPDCGGGGSTRSEATAMEIVSGQLFPLKVGNRLLTDAHTGPQLRRGHSKGVSDGPNPPTVRTRVPHQRPKPLETSIEMSSGLCSTGSHRTILQPQGCRTQPFLQPAACGLVTI